MKTDKISVVVPYWNESETIKKTLSKFANQTLKPYEVILVDSGSTDSSYQIIDEWIQSNSDKIIFKNIGANTGYPSSSRNVGASLASGNLIAFMDCGLNFPLNWLESQNKHLREHKLQIVSNYCFLKGKGSVDIAAVCQTYGYDRPRLVLPGSLMELLVFKETGPFLEKRRSGDDVDWVNRLNKTGFKRGGNPKLKIEYLGTNYARDFATLIKKIRNYGRDSVFLEGYYWPILYILIVLVISAISVLSINYLYIITGCYLLTRGYMIPILKSRNIKFFSSGPIIFLMLPAIGLTIDITKLAAYLEGYYKYGFRSMKKIISH
ncbi:MAG: glycosyltransferase family 2 protein [Oligoflexales bacterium]